MHSPCDVNVGGEGERERAVVFVRPAAAPSAEIAVAWLEPAPAQPIQSSVGRQQIRPKETREEMIMVQNLTNRDRRYYY